MGQIKDKGIETATLGGGCFWCTEAIFQQVRGVVSVESGYSGGLKPSPSYEEVTSGKTGHAEVIQLKFDPEIISYRDILEIFMDTHDPTTLNRQGNDIGTQYRSVIFHHTEAQRQTALQVLKEQQALFTKPVVTYVEPYDAFYKAETYHQDYYARNSSQPYCQVVISPKLQKFKKTYKERLK